MYCGGVQCTMGSGECSKQAMCRAETGRLCRLGEEVDPEGLQLQERRTFYVVSCQMLRAFWHKNYRLPVMRLVMKQQHNLGLRGNSTQTDVASFCELNSTNLRGSKSLVDV